jgi:hypothetical protein
MKASYVDNHLVARQRIVYPCLVTVFSPGVEEADTASPS